VTFYVAMTLQEHVVVASDDRWIIGTRFEYRPRIWPVNDAMVATGAGNMPFVETWATQHFPKHLPSRMDVTALGGAAFPRLLAKDHARAGDEATLLLAGVGLDGPSFLLTTASSEKFVPRVLRGPGQALQLPTPDERESRERSERFVRDLGIRIRSVSEESGVQEVAWALPVLVRLVAHATNAAPTGHVAVVGPEGVRMKSF
jgi:hypothetical protein